MTFYGGQVKRPWPGLAGLKWESKIKKEVFAMEFHIYDFTHRYDKAKRMGERVAYVLSVLAAAAQLLNALGIIG